MLLLTFFLFVGVCVLVIELMAYFVDDKKNMKDLLIEAKQRFKAGEKIEYGR